MALTYSEFRIVAEAEERGQLPPATGAVLRGVFGKCLREMLCVTAAPSCDGCPIAGTCAYRALFDPVPRAHPLQTFSAVPAPFVLSVPFWGERRLRPGDRLEFGLSLLGSAAQRLDLVLLAWRRGLAGGLGPDRVPFGLRTLQQHGPSGSLLAVDLQRPRCEGKAAARCLAASDLVHDDEDCRIDVELLSPLSLRQDGQPVRPGDLRARTWLMALARRVALLADFHGSASLELDFADLARRADAARIEDAGLEWQAWPRYSGRQRSTMPLGGLLGRFSLAGPIKPFQSLARFATGLHVGRHTSFGLGGYSLGGV